MQRANEPIERRTLESAVAVSTSLRGLGLVPVGLIQVLAALAVWHVGPFDHLWVFSVAALLVSASVLYIHRYYDEHYGRATFSRSRRQRVRARVAITVGIASTIVVYVVLTSGDLPFNPMAVAWAMSGLTATLVTPGPRTHRLIIWGALLVVGLLPVWHGDPWTIGVLLGGATYAVVGILDHLVLVRTLGPSASPSLEARDAGA
jgi:4-hydroxybenzoate polyprenyltransferase